MGFDLYSLGQHKTEKGEYFRNNVWWWRRLAQFVCEHTGVIEHEDKPAWQHNEGHEVSGEKAKQIANQLRALIDNGMVKNFQETTLLKIMTLGIGFNLNMIMEVLIHSLWKT